MSLEIYEIYEPFFKNKTRYNVLLGGRAAGRSTLGSQFALLSLLGDEYFRCAIMRDVFHEIRNSIFQEITDRINDVDEQYLLNIPEDEQDLNDNALLKNKIRIVDNTMKFFYKDNSIISKGFKKSSLTQTAKLKSLASFNCVIIEEAEEISEEDFKQLDDSLRSLKGEVRIFLLLNPPHRDHWIIKRWFNLLDTEKKGYYLPELKENITDTTYVHSTYKNNISKLNASTINNYEGYKELDPEHYYTMICGYVSEGIRGKIYKNWKPITTEFFESLPYDPVFGLDFGFSNDPCALCEVKKHNNKLYVREHIYEKGLTNQDLAERYDELGLNKHEILTIADSAEPKSIEELSRLGVYIEPSVKGADSIRAGIKIIEGMEVYYTEDSENLIKEYQNYKWAVNKDKDPLDKPIDKYNHCFVGETKVLTKAGNIDIKDIKKDDLVLTSKGFRKVLKRWDNGLKPVKKYRLQFDTFSVKIEATPDHLVKTEHGWIKISELKSEMTVYLIKNLTERFSDFTQKKDTFQEVVLECIPKFTSFIIEKFQKGITYITEMEILGIIEQKILSWLRVVATKESMQKKDLEKTLHLPKLFKKKELKKQKNGTVQKKVWNGIKNTQKTIILAFGILKKKLASFAKKFLNQKHILTCFAPTPVKVRGAENLRLTMKKEFVLFAQSVLQLTSIQRQNAAEEFVLWNIEAGEEENKQVYDLTVEETHEYFANGMLVHNCLDALRYVVYNDDRLDLEDLNQFSYKF